MATVSWYLTAYGTADQWNTSGCPGHATVEALGFSAPGALIHVFLSVRGRDHGPALLVPEIARTRQ